MLPTTSPIYRFCPPNPAAKFDLTPENLHLPLAQRRPEYQFHARRTLGAAASVVAAEAHMRPGPKSNPPPDDL